MQLLGRRKFDLLICFHWEELYIDVNSLSPENLVKRNSKNNMLL